MLEEVRDRENKLQSEKEAKEALASKIKVCRRIGIRQWWIWELSQSFSVYKMILMILIFVQCRQWKANCWLEEKTLLTTLMNNRER